MLRTALFPWKASIAVFLWRNQRNLESHREIALLKLVHLRSPPHSMQWTYEMYRLRFKYWTRFTGWLFSVSCHVIISVILHESCLPFTYTVTIRVIVLICRVLSGTMALAMYAEEKSKSATWSAAWLTCTIEWCVSTISHLISFFPVFYNTAWHD